MNTRAKRRVTLALLSATALAVLVVPAAAAPDVVIASGLDGPRGVDVGNGGRILVVEVDSGEITQTKDAGASHATKTLATFPQFVPSDVAADNPNSTYVLTSGPPTDDDAEGVPPEALAAAGKLYRLAPNGKLSVVADIAEYQKTDPDPADQEGVPDESNPNGLALLGHGRVLVADAAGNDLLLVDAHGGITTVARFPIEEIPFQPPPGAVFPFPVPPTGTPIPAEAVPTAVAVGPDGAWYVSELKGFPFTPGESKIWRIEPGTVGTTCPSSSCTVFADGFTSVLDIAFGHDGTLYVLEIAKNSVLALEFAGDVVGALIAVENGTRTELASGQLLVPGGVAVGAKGQVYVTNKTLFGPGAGELLRVDG